MEYNFRDIEKKWQKRWAGDDKSWSEEKTFAAKNDSAKPKYYVLDMFPYPSGAGLHVGHPLGYIASDIYSRFKRLTGFNVLHPMGYDSFGLPAEQYAIQTGQHPAKTTEQNIKRYREQLDKLGFSFDWDREVRTSNPDYYKWTQWIFLKLFNAWYNEKTNKAEPIETLIKKLQVTGCRQEAEGTEKKWDELNEKEKSDVLMNYRLAYLSDAYVWWCPSLGSVLANDEVKEGVSERGGYPVERRLMKQWSMRITAYADRLLSGLDAIDWTESLKESQRNWIGKSEGCSLKFGVRSSEFGVEVFTTRPDTIFGVSFLTLAPEHELVEKITTPEQKAKVQAYLEYSKSRSERDRMADVKKVTGEFTGAYVIHPFTGKDVPVWIGDYVLAGYGTGAVMGVPGHDERDHRFAKHFSLPIVQVVEGGDVQETSNEAKEGKMINSDFINGMEVKAAIKCVIEEVEKKGLGKGKVNYRLRDAVFGRQRYWGEPIPIYYKDGIPCPVEEKDLPVVLPEVDKYLPTESGEPPLARAKNWKYKGQYEYEHTTMPGWAGSSWYFLRYMDAKNEKEFASRKTTDYWQNVDLYIGGTEHATGHLLYVRFWTKALKDLGFISTDEPAKKLINQGMIQGVSAYITSFTQINVVGKDNKEVQLIQPRIFISKYKLKEGTPLFEKEVKKILSDYNQQIDFSNLRIPSYGFSHHPIPINLVDENDKVKGSILKEWLVKLNQSKSVELIGDNSIEFSVLRPVEKMSKSKLNVVNPDDMCEQYGADTFRMYEMFLGPLEQSKPWNTNGITGVHGFLKKYWRLFYNEKSEVRSQESEGFFVSDEQPTKAELKVLHKTIKKAKEDIERFSFNTSVSLFMICVNELTDLKCNKRSILEPLTILISPYAPHIAEEIWEKLGHKESISCASYPEYKQQYTVDDSFAYPVSFNGKMKFNLELSLSLSKEDIEKEVLACEQTRKILDGKSPKKVIVVPNKIVNIVV